MEEEKETRESKTTIHCCMTSIYVQIELFLGLNSEGVALNH